MRAIETAGLQDHVFLLGHRRDVRALMTRAHVVILPTHTEGFPRTVWEAMILKCPVIATPAGGVVDLIEHEQTGLLINFNDPIALARALERLMTDPVLRDTLVARAYERVYREYSQDRTTRTLVGALSAPIG